jgi:streptomycin 6-kinase
MNTAHARDALGDHARRWGVALSGETLETPSSLLGFGLRDGRNVVLKVANSRSDETRGARALSHFGTQAAVRVIETSEDGAVLLERAIPGTHLTQLVLNGQDERASEVLCRVMAAIHTPPAPDAGFRSVEDWGRGFERYAASGCSTLPDAQVARAYQLFAALCRSQGERRLLHGDLHHDNVVFDTERGWLVIDPKGVVGEPAYEAGAALRNPQDDPRCLTDRHVIEKRVAAYARCLNAPHERIIGWAYAQAVLSAIWSVEDEEDPTIGLTAAEAFEAMLA